MSLFPLKLFILIVSALYLVVAYNDWQRIYPFMLRVFGKKTASKLGTSTSRALIYLIGGALALFALWWMIRW